MTRILIVDDHQALRAAVRGTLADAFAGVEVGEAESAAEALRRVEEEAWDLVLLDLALRDRNGLETLRQIRMGHPRLPVVVMSMYPEEQYGPRALKSGAAAYYVKGGAPELLAAAIRQALAEPARDP
jgi:DNA-binding NarL/FixJ family response regulator